MKTTHPIEYKSGFGDIIFRKIIRKKAMFGILAFLFGLPMLYIFRDGFRLAPDNSLVTQGYLLLCLLLIIPLSTSVPLFSSNNKMMVSTLFFHFLALLYLIVHRNPDPVIIVWREAVYLIINLVFLLLISYVSYESLEKNNFLTYILYICLLQNIAVILFSAYAGNFSLGQRFSLSMATKDGGVEGNNNPHIFAKSAYFGIVAAVSFLRFQLKTVPRFVVIGTLFSSFIVLALTLAMSSVLTTALFFFFLFVFSNKTMLLYSTLRQVKKPISLFVFLGLLGTLGYFYNKNKEKIEQIFTFISFRFVRIFNTIKQGEYGNDGNMKTDMSAGVRVENIKEVGEFLMKDLESFDLLNILLGRGYFFRYVDSPLVQTFLDMGLLGFSVFLAWHIYAFVMVRKYFKYNYSPLLFFIAASYFTILVTNLAQGLPYGYQNWIYMVLITRYLKNFTPQKSNLNELD